MVSVSSVVALFPCIYDEGKREANSLYLQLKVLNGARSLPAWIGSIVVDPCSSAVMVLASHTCWCTSRTGPSEKEALKKKSDNHPVNAPYYDKILMTIIVCSRSRGCIVS